MRKGMETRAVALLRREAATATMPVHALYGALRAEEGGAFGSPDELGATLRRRTDLFVLLDAGSPLVGLAPWPAHVRAEYEAALRAAGVATEPRVALAETRPPWPAYDFEPDAPGTLERIDASILALWLNASTDSPLRACIAVALRESEEMRRLVSETFDSPETDGAAADESADATISFPRSGRLSR